MYDLSTPALCSTSNVLTHRFLSNGRTHISVDLTELYLVSLSIQYIYGTACALPLAGAWGVANVTHLATW